MEISVNHILNIGGTIMNTVCDVLLTIDKIKLLEDRYMRNNLTENDFKDFIELIGMYKLELLAKKIVK